MGRNGGGGQRVRAMSTQRIMVSGASGLVGKQLSAELMHEGHRVQRLVRHEARAEGEIPWDPDEGKLDRGALEGVDAVVHLAGAGIAKRRWSEKRKRVIRESRVRGTRLLSETLARLDAPPRLLIAASAVGYYGNRGEVWVDEQSEAGEGFLAEVCRAWEEATAPARERGIRVVNLRIGVVLSSKGGALAGMLLPFRFGLGGVVGSGRQYLSWILLDDLVRAIQHLIFASDLDGPVNAVAPEPVTNREFTRVLGRVLRRPTLFPVPAPVARLVFGELGQALLLEGARVSAALLEQTGFLFRFRDLEHALRAEIGEVSD